MVKGDLKSGVVSGKMKENELWHLSIDGVDLKPYSEKVSTASQYIKTGTMVEYDARSGVLYFVKKAGEPSRAIPQDGVNGGIPISKDEFKNGNEVKAEKGAEQPAPPEPGPGQKKPLGGNNCFANASTPKPKEEPKKPYTPPTPEDIRKKIDTNPSPAAATGVPQAAATLNKAINIGVSSKEDYWNARYLADMRNSRRIGLQSCLNIADNILQQCWKPDPNLEMAANIAARIGWSHSIAEGMMKFIEKTLDKEGL